MSRGRSCEHQADKASTFNTITTTAHTLIKDAARHTRVPRVTCITSYKARRSTPADAFANAPAGAAEPASQLHPAALPLLARLLAAPWAVCCIGRPPCGARRAVAVCAANSKAHALNASYVARRLHQRHVDLLA
jgi:hypothetical protein